jgi:hypothetical protein
MSSAVKLLIWAFVSLVMVLLGYFLNEFNFKFIAFGAFALSGTSFFFIPYFRTIQIFFIYLHLEGFFKMITNYNPIIHVGTDLLVVLLFGRFVFSQLKFGMYIREKLPPLTLLFSIHALWFFISFWNPFAVSFFASLAAAKIYLTMPSLFFFGYFLTTNKKRVGQFITPWIIMIFVQCATGIYQFMIGPKSVTGISPQYAIALAKFQGGAFRPFGTTHLSGAPGAYIYMAIPFLLRLLLASPHVTARIFSIAMIIASVVLLLVCQVRAQILKAIIGAVVYFFIYLTKIGSQSKASAGKAFVMMVIALGIGAAGLPYILGFLSSQNADTDRALARSFSVFNKSVTESRSGAMDRFSFYLSRAPMGSGLSRIGPAVSVFSNQIAQSNFFQEGFFSDNLWVALAIDLGLPGVIIITLLVAMIMIYGIRGLKQIQDPYLVGVQAAIICGLLSIALGAPSAEAIIYNPEAAFFWFFSGMLMRIPQL